MKVCELIKRHRAIILGAVFAFIVVPLIVNILLSTPAVIPFDDNGCLSFLGGYLGSVIMAGVTLFVLKKQLNQNHEENEANRRDNESANNKNRELQLQLFKYQQESLWLDKFRDAASNYMQVYNRNDFVALIDQSASAPQFYAPLLKNIYDKENVMRTKLKFLLKNDANLTKLKDLLNDKSGQFFTVLTDIKNIIAYRMTLPNNQDNFYMYCSKNGLCISPESQQILQTFSQVLDFYTLNSIMLQRIIIIDKLSNDVQQALYDYINEEQERINKYITE